MTVLPQSVIVLQRDWLSSNSVVLRGATEAAVVDSGYWTHSEQTVELVSHAAGSLPVRTLVNTHLHSDHCGGNAALQARWPALQTLIPPGLASAVRNWDPVALSYAPTGQYCPPFGFDQTLRPGTNLELGGLAWEVHAAPGHDPHSVILFEPSSRTLISADALWEYGFGVVFPELEGEDAFQDVAATLNLIVRLDPAVVIPGHGAVFTDVAAALARSRGRLAAYEAEPTRHAAHAAKVLLKFKLLELQEVGQAEFLAWAESTPYFRVVQQRWFPEQAPSEWIGFLLADLVRSGAARADAGMLSNA